MGYWTKVSKRIIILLLTLIGIYLAFKLAVFYMPFLIGFIISLFIEPLIRIVKKRTSFTRKTSAIIVLIVIAAILLTALSWGITSLIAEISHLLQGLNEYIENIYDKVQNLISSVKLDKFNIPVDVINILQNSAGDLIKTASDFVKTGLTGILNWLTRNSYDWNLYCNNNNVNIFYLYG